MISYTSYFYESFLDYNFVEIKNHKYESNLEIEGDDLFIELSLRWSFFLYNLSNFSVKFHFYSNGKTL